MRVTRKSRVGCAHQHFKLWWAQPTLQICAKAFLSNWRYEMKRLAGGLMCAGMVLAGLSMTAAQPPGGRPGDGRGGPRGDGPPPLPPVLAALDRNGDGELSADELQSASESLK